jgi:hypothetical protein
VIAQRAADSEHWIAKWIAKIRLGCRSVKASTGLVACAPDREIADSPLVADVALDAVPATADSGPGNGGS